MPTDEGGDVIPHDTGRSGSEIRGEVRTRPSRGCPPSRSTQADPVARLVEEFAAAWERGERPRAEAVLGCHPLLAMQAEASIRLIYEEVCLRQGEGESVPLSELVGRFPQWQAELAVLLDCDRLLGSAPSAPAFPEVGEMLGDFLLAAELGRGARGRCFLASQPSLSDRRVVLKVTPDDQIEHLSMARLQHTNIMPLYSEAAFPERRLRALCMPDLGGATLARILGDLGGVPMDRRSGRTILELLDLNPQACSWPQAVDSPARRFLALTSFVRAVCWIGASLADALQYAHDRGLVHMDVKPSNILLAADGQPMLLDFHLARAPFTIEDAPGEGVGGTPGYMSPEQEAVVAAIETGQAARSGVDARSDLYSMGCVLADLLGVPRRTVGVAEVLGSGSIPREVSTGLLDIIRKCLSTDPAGRYPDASSLAEDLRLHMADLPLRGVSNRSLRERWHKWRRRRPQGLLGVKALLLASGLAGTLAALIWFAFLAPRFRSATHALVEGKVLLDRGDYPEAVRVLTRGAALIEGLPGAGRLARELTAGLRMTDRLEEVDRLHRLVDRLRLAESAVDVHRSSAREVERHCRALWDSRLPLLDRPDVRLAPRLEEQIRDDLLELAVTGAALRVRLETDRARVLEAHRAGLRRVDEAESLFGPNHVLYLAREAHAAALGLSDLAAEAARGAGRVPPRTAWQHDAEGRIRLASGELDRAEAAFERAIALEPQDFWPNFHQGVCAFRRGRYPDAVAAFRVCIALAPDRAECYYNRSLANAALGLTAEASRDLRRAISIDPTLADAPIDPGMSLRRTAPSRDGLP